jgi:hypothetical protein
MTCARCDGLMVMERFEDFQDDTGAMNFNAWHCLVCGEILDQVIITNRRNQPKPLNHRNRNLMVYN